MKRAALWLTTAVVATGAVERTVAAEPDCGLEPPEVARAAPPVPTKARPLSASALGPAVVRQRTAADGRARGALSGKTIYVSAGHGWTWLPGPAEWQTQRGNTHDLVEDLISSEAVSYFLIPYLRNMGAYVVPVRESDRNPELAIVDDADPGFAVEGDASLGDDAGGYATPAFPITGDVNPFTAGGSRVLAATEAEGNAVVWTFDVPADGEYNVTIGYVQNATRAPDAHYVVRHAGGEAHFRVDQRRHGSTWVLLGRFVFERGASPEYGAVALYTDSSQPDATLSADVARIGGGSELIDRGGGTHSRPTWELCARYHAQLAGAPTSVYATTSSDRSDDVGTRSRFAAWDHEDGEDAVYVAWHTNAPTPARGTSSFAYGPSSFGSIDEFAGVPGSLELMDAVHSELMSDLRAVWDPEWGDRGQHTAYFGEVNPNHNPEMPAVLFEIAFHDTAEDAESLRDPRFRRIAARAMAQGIARYFAERDGESLTLPPEPPVKLRAQQTGGRAVRLTWAADSTDAAAGDPPDSYRVYLSRDGRAFDDGREVTGDSYDITDTEPVYARVTAVNAGGESLASAIVAAQVSPGGVAPILIVSGFSRIDGGMAIREDLPTLGVVDRGYVERMNDRSHIARYGAAVASFRASFDSAEVDAVLAGDVELSRYAVVIWFTGEQAPEPIGQTAQQLLTEYVDGGGHLFLSGSEIARELAAQDDEAARAFLAGTLHIAYVADDADSYAASGTGAFSAVAALSFDDSSPGGYDADLADVLDVADGAAAILRYGAGPEGAAATLWEDQVIVFGFPFETIAGQNVRAEVMARVLDTFAVEPDIEDPRDPDGCGCQAPPDRRNSLGALALAVCTVALCARWHRRKERRSATTR